MVAPERSEHSAGGARRTMIMAVVCGLRVGGWWLVWVDSLIYVFPVTTVFFDSRFNIDTFSWLLYTVLIRGIFICWWRMNGIIADHGRKRILDT